jgi:2-methylisocitrate lyase-like PEP mutase family enzyme
VGSTDAVFARRAAAIGHEPDELRANAAGGLVPEVVTRIHEFAAAGAETVYLQILDLDDLDHLRLIAAEVAPHI